MKAEEMRKLNEKELQKLLTNLNFEMMKASSKWGIEKVKNKNIGIKTGSKKGEKTSLQKQIKINIARIKTILKEREYEYTQKNK